jgi:hypothetical protein
MQRVQRMKNRGERSSRQKKPADSESLLAEMSCRFIDQTSKCRHYRERSRRSHLRIENRLLRHKAERQLWTSTISVAGGYYLDHYPGVFRGMVQRCALAQGTSCSQHSLQCFLSSMPWAGAGTPGSAEATTSASRPSTSYWWRWTVSMRATKLSSCHNTRSL